MMTRTASINISISRTAHEHDHEHEQSMIRAPRSRSSLVPVLLIMCVVLLSQSNTNSGNSGHTNSNGNANSGSGGILSGVAAFSVHSSFSLRRSVSVGRTKKQQQHSVSSLFSTTDRPTNTDTHTDSTNDGKDEVVPYVIARGDGSTGGGGLPVPQNVMDRRKHNSV